MRVELSWASAVRAVVVVVAGFVTYGLVRELRALLVLLAFSLFLALAIEPLVRRIRARSDWPRGAAVGVVYGGAVLFVAFLLAIVLPSVVRLAEVVASQAGDWFGDLDAWTGQAFGFPVAAGELSDPTGTAAGAVAGFAQRVLGVAAAGASLVFTLSTVALFTFYLSADMPRVQRSILGRFRPAAQQRIVWVWDRAVEQTGAYFYSRLILMVINGLGFLVAMIVVGVPLTLAVAMAVFAGFVSAFIPAVGTYIGSALPILVTLSLRGLVPALVIVAYTVVYQQLENYVIVPRLSQSTMSLHGGIAFAAVMAGGALGGALGGFVALPIAALVVAVISNSTRSHEVISTSAFDPPDVTPRGVPT